jgi:hypothetical protein
MSDRNPISVDDTERLLRMLLDGFLVEYLCAID